MNARHLAYALLLTLTLPPLLRADEVELEGGRKIKGVIVEQNDRYVRIITTSGRSMKISHRTIVTTIEECQVGDAVVDERLAKVDDLDPEALVAVARWAKKAGRKSWTPVAWYAIKRDADCAGARELLGHAKAGDTWYTSPKLAKKARQKLLEKRLREEGYVPWRGGWVLLDDKAPAIEHPDDFMKDEDGVWRQSTEVMAERGLIRFRGEWVKKPPAEDQTEIDRFKTTVGQDIWVITSPHYRLFVQGLAVARVQELSDLAEKVYTWFGEAMGEGPEYPLLQGQRHEFWILQDQDSFDRWLTHYRARYDMKDAEVNWYRRIGRAVGVMMAARFQRPDDVPLEHWLACYAGSELARGYTHLGPGMPHWFLEVWGLLAQAVHLEEILCTYADRARYEGGGGVADKDTRTLDGAYDLSKNLARTGRDAPLSEIDKLQTNSLTTAHLAKGLTLMHWLFEERRDDLVRWFRETRGRKLLDAIPRGFEGWDASVMDREWRRRVQK